MGARYTFQESEVWEGGHQRPASDGRVVTVKVPTTDIERARAKLPRPRTGRYWILVKSHSGEGRGE